MKILALEFSPPERSVAVVVDGTVRGFVAEQGAHGNRVFGLIAQALAEAGTEQGTIECVAVGLGPGSYAGIRMAIAVAQGWQIASGVKLAGVNSAAAIAWRAQQAGVSGTVNLVFDAQRSEFYCVRYQIEPSHIHGVENFHLLTPEAEQRRRAAGELFFKCDDGGWDAGNAATLTSDARAVAALAERESVFAPGHQLEPVYLRKAEFIKAAKPRFSSGEG